MGVLSDTELEKRLSNDLIIYPRLLSSQVHGIKIDLRLDNTFSIIKDIKKPYYDPIKPLPSDDYLEKTIIPHNNCFILHPGQFILASLFEHFSVPNDLLGRLEGRSSLGRLGIIVHQTASIIDPGYNGSITLELSNAGKLPVALYPLMRIASVTFEKIKAEVKTPYYKQRAAKYQTELSDVGSKLNADIDMKIIEEMHKKYRQFLT